jgi:hypothetical protein
LTDPQGLPAAFVATTRAERVFVIDSVECLLDGRLTMNELAGMSAGPRAKPAAVPNPDRADLLADAALMLDYDNKTIEASRSARLPEFRKLMPQALPVGRTPVVQALTSSYDKAAMTHYQDILHLHLAAAALAVREWSIDHAGALPPTLDALVPAYLPSVADRPDAAGASDGPVPHVTDADRLQRRHGRAQASHRRRRVDLEQGRPRPAAPDFAIPWSRASDRG